MGLEDVSGHTHHITHYTDLRIFLSLSNCRCSDLVTWDEDDFYSRGEEDAYNSRDEVTSIILSTVTPSFESDHLQLQKSINTLDRTTYIYIIRQAVDEGLRKRKGFSEKDFKLAHGALFMRRFFLRCNRTLLIAHLDQ